MFPKLLKVLKILEHPSALNALLCHHVAMTTEHLDAIRLARPASLLDVGANRGQFSLAARALLPSVEIHAFEPLPEARTKFSSIFAGDDRVHLHDVALAAKEGRATLYVADRSDSSSLLPLAEAQKAAYGVGTAGTVEVVKRRLDSQIDLPSLAGPVLLKIDVQGGELDVLKGIADYSTIDLVYVELSFVELYQGQPLFGDVHDFLRDKGYRLRGLFNLSTTQAFGPTQVDALFARDPAQV